MDAVDLVAPRAAEVVAVSPRSISGAVAGLLGIPCPACGAGEGEWCRRRQQHPDRQHERRYERWREAGRPVARIEREVAS